MSLKPVGPELKPTTARAIPKWQRYSWQASVAAGVLSVIHGFHSTLEAAEEIETERGKVLHDAQIDHPFAFGTGETVTVMAGIAVAPGAVGEEGLVGLGTLTTKAGSRISAAEAGTVTRAATESVGVRAFEVGTAADLRARSLVGDGLDVHHVAQAHPLEQIVPGYSRANGPSIVLPRAQHAAIPTVRGQYNGTARSLLAKDIRDLRRFTDAPNSSLFELIDLNKQMYPGAYVRKARVAVGGN